LLGRVNLSSVGFATGFAIMLLGVSRWFWRFGLRSYTSASS
jgi:ABC-type uncharacterized transport system permease subunit